MGGYIFQPFPKCKYHPDGRVLVVADAGEEQRLGLEWSDTLLPSLPPPEDAPVVSPIPDPPRRRGRPRKSPEAP